MSTKRALEPSEQGEWKRSKDPSSGRFYYYHTVTRQTSWAPPAPEPYTRRPVPPDLPQPLNADAWKQPDEKAKSDLPEQLLEEDGVMSLEYKDLYEVIAPVRGDKDKVALITTTLADKFVGYAATANHLRDLGRNLPLADQNDTVMLDAVVDLIRRSYNSTRAVEILTTKQKVPEWRDDMLRHAVWRNLFVELSKSHRDKFLVAGIIPGMAAGGYFEEALCVRG